MNQSLYLALFVAFSALIPVGCDCFLTCKQNQAPALNQSGVALGPAAVAPPSPQQKYAIRMFLLEPVYFTAGKYTISPRAAKVLQRESEWLRQNPDTKVNISGNADNRANKKYNRILAQKRADAVKKRLVALGVSADRIETSSYGEDNPVCTKATKSCYAANRRVDLHAIGHMTVG